MHADFLRLYFSDTDECATGDNNCEQVCINLSGTYECDCNDGYELLANGYGCQSKAMPGS